MVVSSRSVQFAGSALAALLFAAASTGAEAQTVQTNPTQSGSAPAASASGKTTQTRNARAKTRHATRRAVAKTPFPAEAGGAARAERQPVLSQAGPSQAGQRSTVMTTGAALRSGATPFADTSAETVVVTGSALNTRDNTDPNPVQVITAKEIQETGISTLSDYLARLPSVGSSGIPNTETNGGGGVSCTDLRNLGYQRVLVLIDGKRASLNGAADCFDMNTIPIQEVASIEILKDGGSELYGADAVSGVINIKLRHDVDTGDITMRGSITGHSGDQRTGVLSPFKGWDFDQGRGNISLFGQYLTQGGIMQRDRAWALPSQIGDSSNASDLAFGSSYIPNGLFFGTNTGNEYTTNGKGALIAPTASNSTYPFGTEQSLTNAIQDSSLNGDFHYDFSKHFTLYSNVLYSHTNTDEQIAGEPVYGAVGQDGPYPTSITIPANYPGNTTGEPLDMYERYAVWGPRETQTSVDTLTAKVGASGEITHGWNYDASYTYGSTLYSAQTSGVGLYSKLLQEYGLYSLDPGNPDALLGYNPSICTTAKGCVLSNAFSTLSPAAAAYSNYTTHDQDHYQLRDWNLRFNNNHVLHLPWSYGGDLGVALGMEHRGEQLTDVPDPAVQSGDALTNPEGITSGGFDVTEGYIEGKLQLLKNAPLARDLTIDAQGRYSNYNTFGGAKNWKASIDWAPTQDIRFRGTIGTSFRQPNVYELYGAQALGFYSATDPCAGATNAVVVANCKKYGVSNPGTLAQAGAGQVATVSGGNAALSPETGRTYTFGTVITPRWLPGLTASVEYWHYTISDTIGALDTQYILDSCYEGTNPALCSDIARSSNGQISEVSALDQNLGVTITDGIDYDLSYHFPINRRNSITVTNSLQQLLSYREQTQPGGQYYNYTGAIFYSTGTSNPRWRDYFTTTWQHGPVSFTYMLQYIDGMHYNDETEFLTEAEGYGRVTVPSMVLSDVSFAYHRGRWNLTGGIDNIMDKDPPFFPNGSNNTDYYTYSAWIPGRTFWLQLSSKF